MFVTENVSMIWNVRYPKVPGPFDQTSTLQSKISTCLLFLRTVSLSIYAGGHGGLQVKTILLWKGKTYTLPLGQDFRTVRLITGQKLPWKNVKSGSLLLTFRDLSSHISQIFMRMARWGDLHFRKSLDFPNLTCFCKKNWNLVWNGSIWLGRSSY